MTPLAVNFGIAGDTTLGVLNRISDYHSISGSKIIVVAIGYNDLLRRNNDQIIANYKKIIDLIPEKIPILFSAVLPVDELLVQREGGNARILELNASLNDLCSRSGRTYYLDISSIIADPDGNLIDIYHIGDGLHLSELGNDVWITKLKEMIFRKNKKL